MFLSANASKRSLAVLASRPARARGAAAARRRRRRLPAEPAPRARRAARARRRGAASAQPAARLLLDRRVRQRRAAARRAGLRRADAGGGRPDLDDGRAGPAGRARRLVADRPGHRARGRRSGSSPRCSSASTTGAGRLVDVSLYETALGYIGYHLAGYLADGTVPRGEGTRFPTIAPYQVLPTRDGELMVAAGNDRLYAPSAASSARTSSSVDPRFRTNPDRVANRDALIALLEPYFAQDDTASWHERLTARRRSGRTGRGRGGHPRLTADRGARDRAGPPPPRRSRTSACRRCRCRSTAAASSTAARRRSSASTPPRSCARPATRTRRSPTSPQPASSASPKPSNRLLLGAARDGPAAVDAARELAAEQLFEPLRHARSARRGRRRSRRPRGRGGRARPRWRRSPSRAARTGSRRGRRPRRRARSLRPRPPPTRRRRRCGACRGSGRRPGHRGSRSARRSRRTGRGVATPIVSARTTSPAPAATSRSARSATTPGSTSPSNGQPNETLIVAVEGRSATARIRSTRAAASSSVALPLRWLNDSVAASVTLTRSSGVAASRSQPRSLRTSPESSAWTSPDRGDDLLRAGHLRHALRSDEADRLDPRQPGRREPADELRPNLGRERLRLVLEPVARADVAERDAARGEPIRTGAP